MCRWGFSSSHCEKGITVKILLKQIIKLSYGLKSVVQVGETTMKSNQTKFSSVMFIKREGECGPCNPAKSVLVEERIIK